jgi:cytochrome c553
MKTFKKILKWAGIVLGSLVLLLVIAALFISWQFNRQMGRTVTVEVAMIDIPSDSASIASGSKWAALCKSCHGEDLGGKVMFDDPKIATITAHNLTSGKGGIGSDFSDEDWLRALRHGVGKDGRPLFVMPANETALYDKQDLANLIAYLKSVPPVDNEVKGIKTTFMARILAMMGAFGQLFAYDAIDHESGYATAPERGVTVEYGRYMVDVSGCRACHGENLNGSDKGEPGSPPAPNLTPGGNPGKWTEADFLQAVMHGRTPEGKALAPEFMPWQAYGAFPEDNMQAIWAFLQSLEPKENGYK